MPIPKKIEEVVVPKPQEEAESVKIFVAKEIPTVEVREGTDEEGNLVEIETTEEALSKLRNDMEYIKKLLG